MATRSSIFPWKIPWTEDLGELQVKGSQSIGRDLESKQQQHGALQAPF